MVETGNIKLEDNDVEQVNVFLNERVSQMTDLLKEIVEFESPSTDKKLNDKLGNWLCDLFIKLTCGRATIIPNEKCGNFLRGEWGTGDRQILILSHFDTVWPKGTILENPFHIENGNAFGPGVFDMKGGIIQGLFALHALQSLQIELDKKVVFLFTSDEEIGSPYSKPFIEKEAKKSDAVFVLEPALHEEGALKTARKGIAKFHLFIEGNPAHAGIEPEKGVSAIEEMAIQIQYLHSLTDLKRGTTVNVGIVHGGTSTNVIAAMAEAEIEVRVKTQEEFDRILPLIKYLKPTDERIKLQVTGGMTRPPLERTDDIAQLFKLAKAIAKKELGMTLTEDETGGGSDGSLTAPITPTLDGLGAVGDGAHAHHEHLIISEMPKRSALLAKLLLCT